MVNVKKLLEDRLYEAINSQVFPGCVVGVISKTGRRLILPCGRFTYEDSSTQVTEDSVFDLASITKSIPTACLALKLIEEGKISLEDKVKSYILQLSGKYADQITIWNLLTHTIDFQLSLSSLKDLAADDILQTIYKRDLINPPGMSLVYSNTTSVLLGLVLGKVTGRGIDTLADEYFFKPLRMKSTTFHPEKLIKNKIVPTEVDSWRGRTIQGEVHDESAWKLRERLVVGSAGLFSTANDLLNFLEMLLSNGKYNNQHIFNPETIQLMQVNQGERVGEFVTLGWFCNQPQYMGKLCSESTLGKTGFTGTMCLWDAKRAIGMVMLANYTYPLRKSDSKQINSVRQDIADIIWDNASVL